MAKFERGMYFLDQKDMPTRWYNIMADMPGDMPYLLHPGTGKPVTVEDVAHIFSEECSRQELNRTDRWIDIPEELLAVYRTWRPTNLYRAHRLEKALDTPAKIFYKYEGTSQAGSHKPNTATAQAYYAKKEGLKSRACVLRPVPGNGAVLCLWAVRSLTLSARCLWSGLVMTRSLIAAS